MHPSAKNTHNNDHLLSHPSCRQSAAWIAPASRTKIKCNVWGPNVMCLPEVGMFRLHCTRPSNRSTTGGQMARHSCVARTRRDSRLNKPVRGGIQQSWRFTLAAGKARRPPLNSRLGCILFLKTTSMVIRPTMRTPSVISTAEKLGMHPPLCLMAVAMTSLALVQMASRPAVAIVDSSMHRPNGTTRIILTRMSRPDQAPRSRRGTRPTTL